MKRQALLHSADGVSSTSYWHSAAGTRLLASCKLLPALHQLLALHKALQRRVQGS